MILNRIQGIIRHHQKNQAGESDIPDKFKVINILRQHHIHGLTDKYLVFDKNTGAFVNAYDGVTDEMAKKYFWHKPDVFVKDYNLVIEIDGWHVHGDGDFTFGNTKSRNEHYDNTELKRIIISKEFIEMAKISWKSYLKSELRFHGLVH